MTDNELFGNSEQLESGHEKDHVVDPNKMVGDLISRTAVIDELEERLRANGYTNVALVSELNRCIGYIMRLPSAQQWIPCSERLPEKDGEYLTTTEDGLCDVESYGDGEWFYDDVVAWAPLPKPWKGEEND